MSTNQIVQLIGGLAIFLYGMKVMSESLQHAAGHRLRGLLSRMTANKFSGVLSGAAVTTAIQSSSATTVMVVGVVNAGLLNLRQAISVIMGANIGTTVTAWLVAYLGFKFKISAFAYPIIAVGTILLFINRDKTTSWGSSLIGFGILFLGLAAIKTSIPDLKSGAADQDSPLFFMMQYANMGFWSILIFIAFGTLLTVVVQSSSTATAITLTLAFKGYINQELAMAMILGENIGTTITANLAAIAGNLNAKKAALAHTLFNIFGVVWIVAAFPIAQKILNFIFSGHDTGDKTTIGYYLSAFHTGFNIMNTFLLIWFIPVIERSVNFLLDRFAKHPGKQVREFRLLTGGSVRSSELSLFEISEYHKSSLARVLDVFQKVKRILGGEYDSKEIANILHAEDELDQHRNEMLAYFSQIQASGVSGESATQILTLSEQVRLQEQLGDNFAHIAQRLQRARKSKIKLASRRHKELLNEALHILDQHGALVKISMDADSMASSSILSESEILRKTSRKLVKKVEKEVRRKKNEKQEKFLGVALLSDLMYLLDNVSRCLHETVTAGIKYG